MNGLHVDSNVADNKYRDDNDIRDFITCDPDRNYGFDVTSRIRSRIRSSVDVAGAAAVAALAAVALASVDVAASAAGTTKQPTYLF
jgi:hypothetical protein